MKQLRPVRCSIPALQEVFNVLVAAINERTPLKAPNWFTRDSPQGWKPSLRASRGGGGESASSPFEIILRQDGDQWMRGVSGNCYLFPIPGEGEETEDFDPVDITGTLTGDGGSGDDDAGWKETEDGDEIWLEVEFSSWPESYTASIKSKTVDDDIFTSGRVEHDGGNGNDPPEYTQTKARILIGRVEDVGEDDVQLVVRQFVTTNLVMVTTTADGKGEDGGDKQPVACIVLFPYF